MIQGRSEPGLVSPWGGRAAEPAGEQDPPLRHPLPQNLHSQSLGATLSGGGSSGKRPWAPPSSSSKSNRAGRGGGARGVRMARSGRREVTPTGEGQNGEQSGLQPRHALIDDARELRRPSIPRIPQWENKNLQSWQ